MTGAFVCAALSIVPTVRHADYLATGSSVARGQSRDHSRGERGVESRRLSARLSCRRTDGGRLMPTFFQTPRTALTWATLEEWFDGALTIEHRRASRLRNLQAELHLRALPIALVDQCSSRATLAACDRLFRRGPTHFCQPPRGQRAECAADRSDRRDCQSHRATRPRRRPRIDEPWPQQPTRDGPVAPKSACDRPERRIRGAHGITGSAGRTCNSKQSKGDDAMTQTPRHTPGHTPGRWHKQPFTSATDQRLSAYRIVMAPHQRPLPLSMAWEIPRCKTKEMPTSLLPHPSYCTLPKERCSPLSSVVHLTGNTELLPFVKICQGAIALAEPAD